ncbi:Cytochrome [Forsythia ovata]|uniref:Cytochrome n=1 Tax=Forsythia ovata TaxID=205694 RepID=A0ABD1USQ4_9LAMI
MAPVGYFEVCLAVLWFVCLWGLRKYRVVIINWPVFGMLPTLLLSVGRIHDNCTEILRATKRGTFRFKGPWFVNMEILATVNPANVHHIMSANFQNFPKGPKFREMFDVLGDGIFNSDADLWKNQRKITHVLINHQRFNRFLVNTIHEKVEKGLIPILESVCKKSQVIDLQDLFQRLTFDTTCILVTSYDPGCLSIEFPDVPFAKAMDDAEETIFLRHHENQDLKRDDKFLRDTILNLMLAGRDTTSSALTWFIWLVSTHPEIERKIRDELRSSMPAEEAEKCRIFQVQELGKLVYMHAAMCESLRLYPPVPFQHKEPLQAEFLPSGDFVHPKMKIIFSLYAMGRMESIWGKDCLEFKPERWISERGTIKHEPSYKFLAFNAGPRTCLGKEVAFTQMKAVAATIIHNYQVEVVKGHKIAPNCSIILYMKNGLKVRISKRLP